MEQQGCDSPASLALKIYSLKTKHAHDTHWLENSFARKVGSWGGTVGNTAGAHLCSRRSGPQHVYHWVSFMCI